jgi:hypothetical protein
LASSLLIATYGGVAWPLFDPQVGEQGITYSFSVFFRRRSCLFLKKNDGLVQIKSYPWTATDGRGHIPAVCGCQPLLFVFGKRKLRLKMLFTDLL